MTHYFHAAASSTRSLVSLGRIDAMVPSGQAKTPQNGGKFKYFYLVSIYFPTPIRLLIPNTMIQPPSTFLFAPANRYA